MKTFKIKEDGISERVLNEKKYKHVVDPKIIKYKKEIELLNYYNKLLSISIVTLIAVIFILLLLVYNLTSM